MDKQFNPIGPDFVNRNFNDRRITGKLGIPNSPEKGGDYGYRPKPKSGPHDYDSHRGPRDTGWGGVKPKPKGPKPSLPPMAKKSAV